MNCNYLPHTPSAANKLAASLHAWLCCLPCKHGVYARTITLFCCLAWLVFTPCFGGNDKHTVGGRQAAMGNTSVTFTDVFSVFYNQAGLAGINTVTAGVYAENRFLLKDLNFFGAAVAIPTKGGTFGLGATYFGNNLYNDRLINLAYGRKLFNTLSVGIELDYAAISVADYGTANAFTFGLGVQYAIIPKLIAGAQVHNPLRWQFTDFEEDRLPTVISSGIAYLPSEKVTICAEAEKNLDKPLMLKAGFEYNIVEKLSLRAGITTEPVVSSFGIGLNLGTLRIDLANSFHPVLGYSPHFGLIYTAKSRNKEK
ncbi:hypothetical protein C7N43_07570 [Sphingobacteriales bacterium UPWRP_1]|nr:hypothetical protein B6N25_08890 [Sphingobacteriales bacterium TSM_CSS]PSJ77626.1 hypothetical protein C7N43_07570 [Sphingobacteriales bacterium UPWRP_1]